MTNPILPRLVDQLDEVHAELPELLRDPSLSEAEYEKLWESHKQISKSLSAMIQVMRSQK